MIYFVHNQLHMYISKPPNYITILRVGGGGRGYSTGIWVGGSADSTKPWPSSRHKNVYFATLSKRRCGCNFSPCSRLYQSVTIFKTIGRARKFVFHASQRRRAEIMWLRGEERSRRFAGRALFKTQKCEIVYRVQDTPPKGTVHGSLLLLMILLWSGASLCQPKAPQSVQPAAATAQVCDLCTMLPVGVSVIVENVSLLLSSPFHSPVSC